MIGIAKLLPNWAIAELAESFAWYVMRNPTAARRMREAIEEAAYFLIASPIAVSGRLGVVAGTRELPVGQGRFPCCSSALHCRASPMSCPSN